MLEPFKVKFTQDKETTGTVRFKEHGPEADHKIGTLYVKKTTFDGDAPQELEVAVVSKD